MREPAFLRQNKDKWLEYEHMLFQENHEKMDPDRLAELYIQLTDDLAYARTFYPKSQTVRYLNGLAARTHLAIYKNKKEKKGRFLSFWTTELPLIYREAHKYMLYAFIVFTFFFLIGTLLAHHEDEFLRLVLSDGYVDMTIENIENNDPMGVYKDSSSFPMFLRIAYNNIQVSFLAFAFGIFLSVGTIWVLFQNGLMLGSFLTLFHKYGNLSDALPVIYIHGTLEISAIVIAAGAGFMLGNSILFPGTFTRRQSIQKAAKLGVKIILGLVPIFMLASFLESYITRLTEMPLILKLIIIILSLVFVVWYYIIYPIVISREANKWEETL